MYIAAILFVCVVAYIIYQDQKKSKRVVEQVSNSQVEPIIAYPFAGRYEAEVVAPDGNKWGDGTHPNDKSADPAHLGLIYRLGGSFSFIRDNEGKCQGTGELYGNRLRLDFVVPVNGGAVDTETLDPLDKKPNERTAAGANLRLFFNQDGSLTGRCWELEGGKLNDYDTCWKYGDVVGRKVS